MWLFVTACGGVASSPPITDAPHRPGHMQATYHLLDLDHSGGPESVDLGDGRPDGVDLDNDGSLDEISGTADIDNL